MQMKQLKVRDGSGEDFELNWNFDTMDFSEVPRSNPAFASGGGSDLDIGGAAPSVEAALGTGSPEVPF
jgi:hypothetical protein